MSVSKGSFTDFEDAMRAFESGVNPETLQSGFAANFVTAANLQAFQNGQITLRDLQYTSVNSLGFIGYQFGEALLIDTGYYTSAPGTFYLPGQAGPAKNFWTAGTFTGKDGITSLATLETSRQESVILSEFGHNLKILDAGLGTHSLSEFLGQTYTFNGQAFTLTLTGLLAAGHLVGPFGVAAFLLNGAVATDETGTSLLQYMHDFSGYGNLQNMTDAAMKSALEGAFDNLTTMNLAETTWNTDFNHDGTIAGVPVTSGGTTFVGDATNQTFTGTVAGNDTVDYSHATAGVTVDLQKTTAQSPGGGMGTDTLTSIENLIGSGLADKLTGNSSVNSLNGGAGDDIIDGKGGADIMTGGSGNDRYYVDNAGDQIVETAGDATDKVYASVNYALQAAAQVEYLYANAGATGLTLTGNEFSHHIYGGAGADHLSGANGDDLIDGQGGIDVMAGGAGNDTYYVDNASDTVTEIANGGTADKVYASVNYALAAAAQVEYLYANAGATGLTLTGNEFSHHIYGGAGADHLNGGSGNDIIDGKGGIDVMAGGAGNDTYYVDNASDAVTEIANGGTVDKVYASVNYALQAAAQVEYLYANAGATGLTLTGNEFSHHIYGGAGADHLNGGSGDDVIDGQGGIDVMAGGAGNDTYYVDNAGDAITEVANGGTADRAYASVNYALQSAAQVEYLYANAGATGLTLTGNEFSHHIYGGAGGDHLNGGSGNDTIDGKGGIDVMAGGAGDDIYYVDNASDVVTELANGGTADRVYASTSYVLQAGTQVENLFANDGSVGLTLTGNEFSHHIYGGAGADHLNGGSGDDTIDGQGGVDVMAGGGGNDTYYVDNASDVVTEAINGGTLDRVFASTNYTLQAGSEVERLYANDGSVGLTLTGNEFNNLIFGGDGNDTLVGGAGQDRLTGGAGADTFVFKNLADSLPETGKYDLILDFVSGTDHIDLSQIDANSVLAGVQGFHFVGAGAFAQAGDLRAVVGATSTTVSADVNGDGHADFQISLTGAVTLHQSDFII